MRIFIIVEDDQFFIPDMLSMFISDFEGEVVGIAVAKRKYNSWYKSIQGVRRYFERNLIIFGLIGLIKLFLKLATRNINYFFQAKPRTVKEVAKRFGIKYQELHGVNSPETLNLLKCYRIDLIISIQDQIFKKDLIRLPKIGCINKHAALLPKYRGVWPVFWAMLYGEREVGITIHWIDEGTDTGKIIVQKHILIGEDDSLFSLYKQVFDLCGETLIEAINKIEKNPNYGISQTGSEKNYFSFPQKKDVEIFKRLGKKVL